MVIPREMIAARDDDGRRLDRILRKALPELPLSRIHALLRQGLVLVDGTAASAGFRIRAGSIITVPAQCLNRSHQSMTVPSLPPEYILWEGGGLLILNKPAGLAVHGPESLETMVRSYLADKIPPSLSFKPGPLHRLDKPTSGIIAFSTSLEGARAFSDLIQQRQVRKEYLALVQGQLTVPALWEDLLIRDKTKGKTVIVQKHEEKAKTADTQITPLAVSQAFSLISVVIRTGRTHQIRAHAAFHGHPLAGDTKYGGRFQPHGLLLHAYTLELHAEKNLGFPLHVQAPLPAAFYQKISALFGETIAKTF